MELGNELAFCGEAIGVSRRWQIRINYALRWQKMEDVMVRATLVAAIWYGLLMGAQAEEPTFKFVTGNKLFTACRNASVFCVEYISGVISRNMADHGTRFCLPQSITDSHVRDVVVLWLDGHPEKRHLAGSFVVLQALKEGFPCN